MADINRLPLITPDAKIWEKMAWDTPQSYQFFFLYYLAQKGKRSLAQAYRDAYPKKALAAQKKGKTIDAPSNWYRWSNGRDAKDRQKFYRLRHENGVEDVLPVPTWSQRADAWDRHLYAEMLEKAAEEEAQMIKDMRKMVRVAFVKNFEAWHLYSPSGQEKITELSTTTRNLTAVMQAVFGIFKDEEESAGDDEIEKERPEATLTDMQRVQEIARILDKVKASRDASQSP